MSHRGGNLNFPNVHFLFLVKPHRQFSLYIPLYGRKLELTGEATSNYSPSRRHFQNHFSHNFCFSVCPEFPQYVKKNKCAWRICTDFSLEFSAHMLKISLTF